MYFYYKSRATFIGSQKRQPPVFDLSYGWYHFDWLRLPDGISYYAINWSSDMFRSRNSFFLFEFPEYIRPEYFIEGIPTKWRREHLRSTALSKIVHRWKVWAKKRQATRKIVAWMIPYIYSPHRKGLGFLRLYKQIESRDLNNNKEVF